MFQTDIHHFLQSFEFPALTAFMRFITALGYMEFFLLFLITFLLGINYKKAFILFMVLMWTAVVTFVGKNYFSLPRPFHVDNTVQLLDGQLPGESTVTFSKRGATSFWGTLPKEVVDATRQSEHIEYGFPSGHTSIAIALWGTLFCLYREKWVRGICIALMLLVPFSRLYLGVHFLADVLGGLVLGGVMWWLTYQVILRPTKLTAFLQKEHFPIAANASTLFLLAAPFLCFLILPARIFILPAFMLGFGGGFLLVGHKGFPSNTGTVVQRFGRVAIGLLLFGGIGWLLKMLTEAAGIADYSTVEFFRNLLSGLVLVWGATEIAVWLGWFRRDQV